MRGLDLARRVGLVAALIAGCAPAAPPRVVPHAAAAEASWLPLSIEAGKGLAGGAFDEIALDGGEVVRLEADASIALGERIRTGSAFAEVWTNVAPKDGIAIVRPSPTAAALMFPHGAVSRAHVARGSDPGYRWFELEARALSWAEGPLHVPFPPVAPAGRLDLAGFAALDRALANGIAASRDPPSAGRAVTAIRRVAALRAVRALRPASGFPYFLDEIPAPLTMPEERGPAEGVYHLIPGKSLEIRTEGPQLLHVWARAVRGEVDRIVRLRVLEGDRLRAAGGGAVLRNGGPTPELPEPDAEPGDVPLRRAIVHVPPGPHLYRIELTGGQAFIRMLLAKPVVHLEDGIAATKDEDHELEVASETCERRDAPALCAMALALLGRDDDDGGAPVPRSFTWSTALAESPREVRAVAEMLAGGGPRDPSVELELRASDGDTRAMARLDAIASLSLDDSLRAAWLRGWARGTRWSVEEETPAGDESIDPRPRETWTSLLLQDEDRPECSAATDAPWPEITTEDAAYGAEGWYGAPALTLLAVTSCGDPGPVGLVVDGRTLKANPAGPVSTWHVLVRGAAVHARRLAPAAGHVYAVAPEMAACGARWAQISAPRIARAHPALSFASPASEARGLEVWLREGAAERQEITVSPVRPSGQRSWPVRIVVVRQPGLSAVDNRGQRWRRVARIGLPAWANEGVEVRGPDAVAVRAISRIPKAAEETRPVSIESLSNRNGSIALDEGAVIRLSRKILQTPLADRGALYLERALLLARAGAEWAAYEDASAAKKLGATGRQAEDPVVLVRRTLRVGPPRPFTLAPGIQAYGVEPDFEASAKRCGTSSGPRGALAEVASRLAEQAGEEAPVWDRELAIAAFAAAGANPSDPRGQTFVDRALGGSWWHALAPPELAAFRVKRERPEPPDPPVDGMGALRARFVTGDPFEGAHYVAINERHEVKAVLAGLSPAKARVDVVCAPVSPAAAVDARCPIVFGMGTSAPVRVLAGPDGRASHDLPPEPKTGPPVPFIIAVPKDPARWSAVARIVLDREVPGATHVERVGWVIGPSEPHGRLLVRANKSIAAAFERGLFRIDARAEPGESPKVVLDIDGKEQSVPTDGSALLFFLRSHSRVAITSLGGTSTIAFAERVGPTEPEPNIADQLAPPPETHRAPAAGVADAAVARPSWQRAAENSPPPLSPLEDSLGTLWAGTLARYSTVSDEDADTAQDSRVSLIAGYRRRIESVNLWGGVSVLARTRVGNPTYGGSAFLYEDADRVHLRVMAGSDFFRQTIDARPVQTFAPHAFVEYSWRVGRDFFILPRLGYDGFYTSADGRLSKLNGVDEDVYNYVRAKRPSVVFAQALFWSVPYFNDIFYLRARVSADAKHEHLSHVAARPGVYIALGNLDLGGYVDAAWYSAIPYVQLTPLTQVVAALTATFNGWITPGSFELQPQIGARVRADAPGWEAFAGVNVMASRRRGLRDYSSLELDFPEQLGGGVPWRGGDQDGSR